MAKWVEIGDLRVIEELFGLVRDDIAPGTGVDADAFWKALGRIVKELAPKNRLLLDKRNALQRQIDAWCQARKGQPLKIDQYRGFLKEIGYLVPEGEDFRVSTAKVDREIAKVSGPQLVVPLDNARYALNAANARWGSLYDALYGTDVVPETDGAEKGEAYNPRRGAKVIARTEAFLDEAIGLKGASFSEVTGFSLAESRGKKVRIG
jgi:malate synthase